MVFSISPISEKNTVEEYNYLEINLLNGGIGSMTSHQNKTYLVL